MSACSSACFISNCLSFVFGGEGRGVCFKLIFVRIGQYNLSLLHEAQIELIEFSQNSLIIEVVPIIKYQSQYIMYNS
jgi:hypothetical protein